MVPGIDYHLLHRKDGYRVVIPDGNVSDANGRGDRAGSRTDPTSGITRLCPQTAHRLHVQITLIGQTAVLGVVGTPAQEKSVDIKRRARQS